ncbi:hypothetical protein [Nocardia fusca]|uniref:hypothetical protein n=1 Tax=Nocardia fusca TaxID=941183 RepID=UPI0007A7410C|nr:hypothetical protein [Nocardia fusca]
MNEESVLGRAAAWSRRNRVWFWTGGVIVVVSAVIGVGTRLTMDRTQNADWFAGIGQWVGGAGSVIAAVVALWIATSDRRRAEQVRAEEHDERAADLAREAGLVKIESAELAPAVQVMPGQSRAGFSVRNRRNVRLFDIEIVRVVYEGNEVTDMEFDDQYGLWDTVNERKESGFIDYMSTLVLKPDSVLTVYPKDWKAVPADYAAARYTDESGVRWEVDTNGGLARKVE